MSPDEHPQARADRHVRKLVTSRCAERLQRVVNEKWDAGEKGKIYTTFDIIEACGAGTVQLLMMGAIGSSNGLTI